MTTTHETLDWNIARTITHQATIGALMTLGATDLFAMTATDTRAGGAMWNVRIIPMRKDGTRGTRPRVMKLRIELTHRDDYNITVDYINRGKPVTHYTAEGVYCDQLAKILLALDWDGDEILNPRYA